MVRAVPAVQALNSVAAAAANERGADELPPEARVVALLAVLALALAGVLLVACVLTIGRWIRRRVYDEDGFSRSKRMGPASTRRSTSAHPTVHGRSDETYHGGSDADTRAGR